MKRKVLLGLMIVAMLFSLTACASPEKTYKDAQSLLSKGEYAKAAEKFETLGSYEEAAILTIYCKACAMCEDGDFEDGIEALKNLGNYKDAQMRIDYYSARSWDDASVGTTEFGWMEKAIEIYSENPLYLDSQARITALEKRIADGLAKLYNDAKTAVANGNYDVALKNYKKIPGYLDAKEQMEATYYAKGEALRSAGDYAEAVEAFEKAGKYRDAQTQMLATYYAQGEVKLAAGDYEGAVEAFEWAASYLYSDAETQILATHYAEGEAKLAAGDIEGAEKAFKNAGNYSDAQERMPAYYYAEGEAKFAAGEYDDAVKAFEKAGKYSDAETQIKETRYQQAKALMKAKDYAGVYNIFITIKGYKDVNELLTNDANLKAADAKFTVGNYVTFGSYPQTAAGNDNTPIEWQVLAREGDKALLISKYALDSKRYHKSRTDITWEECSLRNWLNDDFLNKAFSKEEQACILTTNVTADKNPSYSTDPGNDTQDKVFLLSIPEAEKYFKNDDARECTPTAYAVQQGAWQASVSLIEGNCCWWLRSPGGWGPDAAAIVDGGGTVYRGGNPVVNGDGAVRPALWVDLESGIF